VIERGGLGVLVGVGDLRRAQQCHVTHVGERADVEDGLIGELMAVPEPDTLLSGQIGATDQLGVRDDPDVEILPLPER